MSADSSMPSANATTKEELESRHRKEQRDLQARVTQKKKQATKKTRKGVNDECEQLERELKERQQRERDDLNSGPKPEGEADDTLRADSQQDENRLTGTVQCLESNGASRTHSNVDNDVAAGSEQKVGKKPNRQKARLARRAAEQEAVAEEAASEAAYMTDYKAREQEAIGAAIVSHGLVEHKVRSDGHCLYAAMADQLKQADIPLDRAMEDKSLEDYRVIRKEVAAWVLKHPDDYLPFLDEEDMVKGIDGYASKIRDTGEWGGQLEIAACARRWGLVVHVLQGDGRIEKIEGGEAPGKDCWLAYYKHSFGLGEHYNSLRKK